MAQGALKLVLEPILRGFTGDVDGVRSRLGAKPCVSSVAVLDRNGAAHLQVGVSDERAALTQLLPLVMADGVTVLEFGRKKAADLEEVFLSMRELDPRLPKSWA